jgi:hypothetical protein
MADITLLVREFEIADETSLRRIGLDMDSAFIEMGGLGSNLSIKKQKADYSPALEKLKFPLVYDNTYFNKSESVRKIIGIANVPALGISNAEVIYQVNYTRTYSVSNWGKVKLHGAANEIDVLLLNYIETTYDTVWMNGGLLPDFMLEPLGLKQGSKNNWQGIFFYGKDQKEYLLNAGKYTNQFGSDSYYGHGLSSLITSVTDIDDRRSSLSWPNPTIGKSTLKFCKTNETAWIINIYNSYGSLVKSMPVDNPSGEVLLDINFGSDSPVGIYYVSICDELSVVKHSDRIILTR